MRHVVLRQNSLALRAALLLTVAGVVAGCSSDTRRFAPAPWSSAQQQHNMTFGNGQGAPAPETTGSIGQRPPAAVQSQSLPPPSGTPQQSSWTPPPRANYALQQGAQPVATPAPRPAQAASRMPQQTPRMPANAPANAWNEPAQAARTHTVAPGESVVSIARRYNVPPARLAQANQLGPSDRLQIGQTIAIPTAGAAIAAATPARREPDPVQTASAPADRRDPRPQAQAPATPAQQVAAPAAPPAQQQQRPAAAEQRAAVPEPQSRTSTEFRWPVRGRVVTNFGRQPGGGQSDGIAIAVPAGTPVKAAENGVVAYAGSELRGYGNLILIRHEGDWVTAYAHNSELLVRRGENVRRGQTIARAGQSGSVSQPMVHFEIRRGSTPVNPTEHLTGG